MEPEALSRLKHFAKRGEVDLAIELLARRPKWAEEEAGFQVMAGLAARLLDVARGQLGGGIPSPELVDDFHGFLQKVKLFIRTEPQVFLDLRKDMRESRGRRMAHLARGLYISGISKGDDLLVSAGTVSSPGHFYSSVIFSAGSAQLGSITNSVVFCDGDVTVQYHITNSLIVARGDVRCPSTVRGSRIVTCSFVGYAPRTGFQDTILKEAQPIPLGFVKFFDPAREGIAVEAAEGGVRVKDADAAKPFAKAGLRKGDLIVSLGGEPVASPEVFRRVLRAKMAVGENILFRVRREGRNVEVSVPAPR
jgi:hypothetical protein